jgi:peptidoglycan/LPS O-acetylase OafA/YrhL
MKFKFDPLAKEIPSIGLLRGIASAMVCYFHLAHENPRLLPPQNIIKESAAWGWVGVQVFFIISGFVIPYSMFVNNYSIEKWWLFLKKRIIRIEPPYLISIVLVLVLNYISALFPSYKGQPFVLDWTNVASHIAYLNIFTGQKWLQDVYWTLAVEFQYYLLIAAVFGLVVSKSIFYRLLFFTGFIAMMFLTIPAKGFIMPYTAYFMLGILLFQYYCDLISSIEFCVLGLLSCCVMFYLQGWQMVAVSAVAMCIIGLVKKVPSFFRMLGTVSFSLYLVHIPIGGRINNLAAGLTDNIHLKEAVVFVSFAASIFFAWLFYHAVEKRFKKLSAALNYKPGITALANQRTG